MTRELAHAYLSPLVGQKKGHISMRETLEFQGSVKEIKHLSAILKIGHDGSEISRACKHMVRKLPDP
jgi:hypothetical protein